VDFVISVQSGSGLRISFHSITRDPWVQLLPQGTERRGLTLVTPSDVPVIRSSERAAVRRQLSTYETRENEYVFFPVV
jgi:hypothetical protein